MRLTLSSDGSLEKTEGRESCEYPMHHGDLSDSCWRLKVLTLILELPRVVICGEVMLECAPKTRSKRVYTYGKQEWNWIKGIRQD